MVSHLIDLDGVADAFDRLRRGEGDRTVVVVDPELAGVDRPEGAVSRERPLRPSTTTA